MYRYYPQIHPKIIYLFTFMLLFLLFTLMLLFRQTTNTYLSPQLLVYMPIDVPIHDPTCSCYTFIPINRSDLLVHGSTVQHVHRWTCSSVYLFSLLLLFWHNLRNDLSTHLLGYLHKDPPENIFTCLPSCLSFHKDLPVTTTTCVHAHRCTCS